MIFYGNLSGYGLQIAPKIWVYLMNADEDNPDLKDYRGFFDLEVKFGKADSIVADTHFWYAREGASVQLDVTYPLNRHLPTNLNAYLYVQYANRLAEKLRLYRERSKAFRIGISIVR
jgi:outer membrane phospholipase A